MDVQNQKTKRGGRSWVAIAAGGALLVCSLAASHEPASNAKNPFPATADSIARGRAVYGKHCASCHGPAGRGDGKAAIDLDPAPTDLSDPKVAHKADGELFRQITRGKRPMPGFRRTLEEEDRWHVVNFIRTFSSSQAHAGEH